MIEFRSEHNFVKTRLITMVLSIEIQQIFSLNIIVLISILEMQNAYRVPIYVSQEHSKLSLEPLFTNCNVLQNVNFIESTEINELEY